MSILKVFSYCEDFDEYIANPDLNVVGILLQIRDCLVDKGYKKCPNLPVTLKKIYVRYEIDYDTVKKWDKLPFGCSIEILRQMSRKKQVFQNAVKYDDEIYNSIIETNKGMVDIEKIHKRWMKFNFASCYFETGGKIIVNSLDEMIHKLNELIDEAKEYSHIKYVGNLHFKLRKYYKYLTYINPAESFLYSDSYSFDIYNIDCITVKEFIQLDTNKIKEQLLSAPENKWLISE